MYKRLILILPLLLVVFSMVAPAQAKVHVPLTTDCSHYCAGGGYWLGNTYGFHAITQVNDPSFTDNNTGVYALQFILRKTATANNPAIVIGYVKAAKNNPNGPCGAYGEGKTVIMMAAYFSSGASAGTFCQQPDPRDINSSADFYYQMGNCEANDPGIWGTYIGFVSTATHCWDYDSDGQSVPYYKIEYVNSIIDHVNGHQVWGSYIALNQWATPDGVLHFQTVDQQNVHDGPNGVPQFYWPLPPSQYANGGQAYYCVYDSAYSSCNLGG